ncbi:hypothetical protein [Robertmurraya kyonggiensis]|uniref:Uncharacterized protein n=1 Tax=Robertmurraya kyonggiensis TaxID=1037680 RepID=A0A4U1D1T1_9BACI|nr:hypothetical protein [Robertmurraya kyonggiensis]TKC15693.1 hypothetical protein FA727_16335 [Robertmurraya kyonggiensis]
MRKVVFVLVVLFFILLTVGIVTMYITSEEAIASGIISGAISGIGAIIGGSLTLIGVMWTIKRQEKVERLNKLPSDIINSWKIQKQFAFPFALYHELPEDPYKKNVEIIEEFYNDNEEWVTELSAQISAEVYNLVNSFFTHISDFSSFEGRNELDKWFEKAFQYQDKLGKIIDSYEKDYEQLR